MLKKRCGRTRRNKRNSRRRWKLRSLRKRRRSRQRGTRRRKRSRRLQSQQDLNCKEPPYHHHLTMPHRSFPKRRSVIDGRRRRQKKLCRHLELDKLNTRRKLKQRSSCKGKRYLTRHGKKTERVLQCRTQKKM